MPQLNPEFFVSQLFWLVVTFSFLFIFLWRISLPRIGNVLEKRERKISEDLTAAKELQIEAEKIQETIENQLKPTQTVFENFTTFRLRKSSKSKNQSKMDQKRRPNDRKFAGNDRKLRRKRSKTAPKTIENGARNDRKCRRRYRQWRRKRSKTTPKRSNMAPKHRKHRRNEAFAFKY